MGCLRPVAFCVRFCSEEEKSLRGILAKQIEILKGHRSELLTETGKDSHDHWAEISCSCMASRMHRKTLHVAEGR